MPCGQFVPQPCCQMHSDVASPIQILFWVALFQCWSRLLLPVSLLWTHIWQTYPSVVDKYLSGIHLLEWHDQPLGQNMPKLESWLVLPWWLQMPPGVWTPSTITCHSLGVPSMVLPPVSVCWSNTLGSSSYLGCSPVLSYTPVHPFAWWNQLSLDQCSCLLGWVATQRIWTPWSEIVSCLGWTWHCWFGLSWANWELLCHGLSHHLPWSTHHLLCQ